MDPAFVLQGAMVCREPELSDPKTIFEFLWKRLCQSIETHGMVLPLVHFIRKDQIEFFDFQPIADRVEGKALLYTLIRQRVHDELDIDGVALSFEAGTWGTPDFKAIILTLDWRDIGVTFSRIGKKIITDNKAKISEVTNTTIDGFSDFFQTDQLQACKERALLQ